MLAEKVKLLPPGPGVYLFLNKKGRVIYVGKANNLRQRVKSYFAAGHSADPKTQALVKNIADLAYLLTDSEIEALILESNLIKKHQPKYNIRLTDDKSYPYLRLTLAEDYPRLLITRDLPRDGSRYFGPYPNVGAIQEIVKLLQKVFPLRTCVQKEVKKRKRPCLQAHLRRCLAPCQGQVSREEYRQMITAVIHFLEGKGEKIKQTLARRMEEAAAKMDYEKAAEIRDQLQAITQLGAKQKMISPRLVDFDVLNYAIGQGLSCVQIFFIRAGKLMGGAHFFLAGDVARASAEVSTVFLPQYYQQAGFIPREICVPEAIPTKEVLEKWLSEKKGGRVILSVPQRGQKKALLTLAAKNATESLQREMTLREGRRQKAKTALAEIATALALEEPPERIECYDLSHFQGRETVAAMVVFEAGRPKPSAYRRFKIKTVDGPDDFAGMAEVMRRRWQRFLAGDARFAPPPDLVLLDGGKGQLSAVLAVLQELGVTDLPVVALTEEREKLFYGAKAVPLILPSDSAGLNLFRRLRDEAHRFAVTYHRLLRGKRNLASVLDDIPGLGPHRKTELLQFFQYSLAKIRQASWEELQQVPHLGQKTAWQVWNFFHTEGEKGDNLPD